MNLRSSFRFLAFVLIVGAAVWVAYTFQKYPRVLVPGVRTATASISVIFGLAAAIFSVLAAALDAVPQGADPAIAKARRKSVISDDFRTLQRVHGLLVCAVVTIISGIFYVFSVGLDSREVLIRCLAAVFGFGLTVTLSYTLVLPSVLAKLIQRSVYFKLKN